MKIADVLLLDFDFEIANTRRTLERIPNTCGSYKPHDKSMPCGRLAEHVALLCDFGSFILSTDEMDVATHKWPDFVFTGHEGLLRGLDESSRNLRARLASMSDEELQQNWTLRYGDKIISVAPKMELYRTMFLNHLVHHRAQLGVYLRLQDLPVPGLYGPSADERFAA
jgi:uncharacterized damage-inducible protein DinB